MQRTPKSCTTCKNQKRQCDRVTPTCSRCQRTGVACVYPDDPPTLAEYTAAVIAMLDRSVDLKNKVRLLNNRQGEGGEDASAGGGTRIETRRAEKKRRLGEVLETLQASLDEIGLEMNQLEEVKDAKQEITRPSSMVKMQKIPNRDGPATDPAGFQQTLWRLYPRNKDGSITFETDAKTLTELHHALVHVLSPIIPPHISIPTKATASEMFQYSQESRQIAKPTRLGTVRLIIFAWVMLLEDQSPLTSLTPPNGPQLLERSLLIPYLDHNCCSLLRINLWDKRQFMQRYDSGQISPFLASSICVLSLCYAVPEHHCHSEDDLRKSYELADAYYVRARNLMEDLFDEPDLQTVQAIGILNYYAGARKYNFYLGKRFMDLCLRLAYSLGLHCLPDSSPRPDELEEMRVTWHFLYYGDFLGVLLCTRTPLDDTEIRLNPPPDPTLTSVHPDTHIIRTFWAHYCQLVSIWKRVLSFTLKPDYDLDHPSTIALEQELVGWYDAVPPTWHHDKTTDYALYSPLAAQAVLTLKLHSEAARYFFIKPIIEELDVAMVRDAREGRMRPEKVEALHKQCTRVFRTAWELAWLCRVLVVRLGVTCNPPMWICYFSCVALERIFSLFEGLVQDGEDKWQPPSTLRLVIERNLRWNLSLVRRTVAFRHDVESGKLYVELMERICTAIGVDIVDLPKDEEEDEGLDGEEKRDVELAVSEMREWLMPVIIGLDL